MPYKYVQVAGVATYVHHTGRTTLPQQPPDWSRGETVVCLHDAGGNQGVFAGLLEALSGSHSPVAFDQPGHGRSGGLDSLGSIASMAKFTRELLGALRIERPVLLGHAMGGAVALQLALESPAPLRALILLSACASGAELAARIEATRRVAEGKERRPFARERYGPQASPEVLQRGFLEELKTDPRSLLGDLLACRDWPGAGEAASLRAPALVVYGEHESGSAAAEARSLAARISGARCAVIPGAGHAIPIEQPAALGREVDAFLAGLGG